MERLHTSAAWILLHRPLQIGECWKIYFAVVNKIFGCIIWTKPSQLWRAASNQGKWTSNRNLPCNVSPCWKAVHKSNWVLRWDEDKACKWWAHVAKSFYLGLTFYSTELPKNSIFCLASTKTWGNCVQTWGRCLSRWWSVLICHAPCWWWWCSALLGWCLVLHMVL